MENLATKSLSYTTGNGWNLVGNSLTCGINWNNVVFSGPEVNTTLYFTKNNQMASYIPPSGPSVNGGTAHIPPLQAFL